MSMQITHIRALLQSALPLLIFTCSATTAIWWGLQSSPLPTGNHLRLHHAITNLPTGSPEVKQEILVAGHSLIDPFFRNEKNPISVPIIQDLNLEEIQLSTIAMGPKGRYCIINGDLFHEDQSEKGFSVHEILEDRVIISTNLETFSLVPGSKVAIQAGRVVLQDKALNELQTEQQDKIIPPYQNGE